jgi:hypothetical protein
MGMVRIYVRLKSFDLALHLEFETTKILIRFQLVLFKENKLNGPTHSKLGLLQRMQLSWSVRSA